MKSFIKSSFLLILISVVFNIGLNDAYAKEASSSISKTDKIETVNAVPLQCSKSSATNTAVPFSGIMAINLIDECQPGVIVLENDTVILIFPDCTLVIDDQDGDEPVVIKA